MKTNQEVFDKACEIFRDKDFKRCVRRSSCLYFNPADSNRCVIGKMMPMSMAKRVSEDLGVCINTLIKKDIEVAQYFEGVDVDLLDELQDVHDDPTIQSYMEYKEEVLQKIATKYNLKYESPESKANL